MKMNRRDFLKSSVVAAGALCFSPIAGAAAAASYMDARNDPERTVKQIRLAEAPALDDFGKIDTSFTIPRVTLNNGVKMPLIGYGTLNLPKEECAKCVATAIEHGFRLIDTAKNYINERDVGEGIRLSGIDRKELFVSSKLWMEDAGYEKTKKAFQRTLDRLRLDYLDMYLIHQPFGDIHGAWRAMEELYRAGKIRAIGVSNFHPDRLLDLMLSHSVRPVVNQIENHPYFQRSEDVAVNREYGVLPEAWSPLTKLRRPELLEEPVLVALGKKYGKSPAQIILHWQVQRGVVAVPKARQEFHMIENLNIFDFSLTDEEMQSIALLDTGKPLNFDHRNYKDVIWFYTRASRTDPLDKK